MTNVLLVEPHADTRIMYALFLSSNGMVVQSLGETTTAFAHALASDVVIISAHVPTPKDGLRFINELRHTCDVPIIVVSSSVYPADVRRAWEAGATVFLEKPCLPDTLLFVVQRVLAQRGRTGANGPSLAEAIDLPRRTA